MKSRVFEKLLEIISKEKESFATLLNADNILGLNVTYDEIINYLEYSYEETTLKVELKNNILITEGDILSILKIIHDLEYYQGNFILYINDDNIGTITYLVSRANKIYKLLDIDVKIKIDYSENYNKYADDFVTIIGSEDFVNTSYKDFKEYNLIIT